VGSSLK
jgi:Ni/Co efflux regulator RcnB